MNYLKIYERFCESKRNALKHNDCLQRHLVIPAGIWGSSDAPENVIWLSSLQEQVFAYLLLSKIYPYSKVVAERKKQLLKMRGRKKRKIPYPRKPHTAATRAKMSASHLGKTFSAESRRKMSEAKRGVKFTEAHIAARSESRRRNAKGFSAESREKMRLAALNRGKRKVSLIESTNNWSVVK